MLVNLFEADILFTALSPVCSRSAHPNWGYGEVNPFGAVTLSREIPQSVLATLTQTGVMEKSTPSGLIHKQSRQIAVVDVGQQGPIPVPAPSEQSTSINSSHILTVGTLVRASAHGFAQIIPVISLRTHERTSIRAFGMTGARPAQGAATTTDDGLVRTHERTSLQVE